jgi:hypothetical protein
MIWPGMACRFSDQMPHLTRQGPVLPRCLALDERSQLALNGHADLVLSL